MLVNKATITYNDDVSTVSSASGHTWSPNNHTTSAADNNDNDHEGGDEGWQMLQHHDALSAPGRMNHTDEGDGLIEGLDSHEYPPFAPAIRVPVVDTANDEQKENGLHSDGVPAAAARPPPVPQIVEVDAENGTIRVEMENEENGHDSNGPCLGMNARGAARNPTTRTSSGMNMRNLTSYQKCWLIVFIRKCARNTGAYSRSAARKYSPNVKRVASRSATAIKEASARSASFVRTQSPSVQHRQQQLPVGDKARSSIKVVEEHVKKISKATVEGVQKASIATVKGVKELEEKHHILRKSKNSLKKGGRMIRNVWNGKPLNTRHSPPQMTPEVRVVEDLAAHPFSSFPAVEEGASTKESPPPPTSE